MVRFPKCKLGKTLSISKQTQIFNVSNGLAASTTVRHFGLMNTYVTKVSPFESLVWNCQTLNTSFVLCINLYWGPNWLWLFTILRNGSGIPPPQIKKIIRLPHVPSISTSTKNPLINSWPGGIGRPLAWLRCFPELISFPGDGVIRTPFLHLWWSCPKK